MHTHTPPAVRESLVLVPEGTFSKLQNWNEGDRKGDGMRRKGKEGRKLKRN
jgi:hypothetical protein